MNGLYMSGVGQPGVLGVGFGLVIAPFIFVRLGGGLPRPEDLSTLMPTTYQLLLLAW